ncbi:CynX/NimT family MFS transporter [Pseudooceanicola sp. MF1-13]|uniref:MFS transporter n=1 Tax=Pseudooceanicola sp. MF1-13 TaxID=3379095 RepID=UPI0038915BA8
MTQTTTAKPPDKRRWFALAGVWLVYALFGMMTASVAPLLPEIRANLGAGNGQMGAILGAWPLTYVAAAIPCGILLDRVGPRIGLLAATVVIALSGLLRSVADGPTMMLLAVGVFGLGGPLISVGAPKLIASLFTGADRGMAMGIYVTGPSLGAIIMLSTANEVLVPLVGNWRGVMVLLSVGALLSGGIWLGCAALARLPKVEVNAEPFDRRAVMRMVRQRDVILVLLMAVGIFYVNHALNNWLPTILRSYGTEPARAGVLSAVPTLVGIVAAITLPRFATEGRRLSMLVVIVTGALLASLLLQLTTGPGLLAGLILQGIARGTMNTIAVLILMDLPSVPKDRVGIAGGIFFSAAEIGGVLGPLSFGLLREATGAFIVPLASLTVVCMTLIGLALAMRRRA